MYLFVYTNVYNWPLTIFVKNLKHTHDIIIYFVGTHNRNNSTNRA